MTYIRAWMSLKFGRIRPQTTELAALEGLKKSHSVIMGKTTHHIFSAIFHRILFIHASNDDIRESLDAFEIWPDPTTGFHGNR